MRVNILTSFMMMALACVILLHPFFPLVCLKITKDAHEFS